ncbi:MAG: hypothetical protein COV07_02715 [Candidatus Vogelbacteria bacterium CG10_big_fil_rev_8_21_14_0_10_45_14]|uniref:Uncharacterized protein n=1 Tax=Candidatus Vogelbacteria bacterium CG10_big_fil_rev_8_21_14_0_10_45_14 TaxID=1975042 RepID=A0A2H0RJL3_9BACT|nr:MAG: hypothetical protein COV07_02715 [Candidatus Vogelbacteria bacterium CG10_big_fil_rev_8_21_14_0_10_45_14]
MMGSSPKGSNLYIATTCNSGWQSNGSKPPIFHKDCGDPKKSLCDLAATTAGGGGPAYACLWQVCKLKGGGNAIWDKNTKKCGCDNPGSNLGGFKDGIATAGLNSVPTTPAQNPSQVSGSSETRNDAVNREALTKAGITINKQENGPDGSTSLNGLTEQSTNKLISIRGASGDSGMTITGGSEAGHSTHTDASGNSTQTVDLRYTAGSNLNKYIETGIKSGSSYYFSQSDGSWVRFYNEPGSTNSFGTQPRHWHVELDTKRRP